MPKNKVLDMVYIAFFAVLIAVCSWITVPAMVPFTMQTFAVFVTLGLIGGKRGTISVLVYILLGAAGAPVFSSFNAGFGVLLGTTGGYIIGFVFSALTFWLVVKLFGGKTFVLVLAMLAGLIICYAFGTAWFMAVYAKNSGDIGLLSALSWCVFPFVIPDVLKIALAVVISKRLSKYVKCS